MLIATGVTDDTGGRVLDALKLFKCAKSLFNQEVDLTFQGYNDKTKLANDIGKFFPQKIERIRNFRRVFRGQGLGSVLRSGWPHRQHSVHI